MRYFHNKNFNGIILRRTNDELRELIWKSQEMYPKIYPGAKWQEKKSQWVFPSGAKLWMTYLERDEDVLRYQGLAFSYIAFDELTQYATPFAWNYMRSRLRTTDPELPLFQRATTNPGGRVQLDLCESGIFHSQAIRVPEVRANTYEELTARERFNAVQSIRYSQIPHTTHEFKCLNVSMTYERTVQLNRNRSSLQSFLTLTLTCSCLFFTEN